MEQIVWEYRVATFKNFAGSFGNLKRDLDAYGRAGWELVSLSSTVKSVVNMTGNDMVAVFKRPGTGEVDHGAEPGLDTGTEDSGWM